VLRRVARNSEKEFSRALAELPARQSLTAIVNSRHYAEVSTRVTLRL
jgi:hypothetical protein